jgi:hypothetical protein
MSQHKNIESMLDRGEKIDSLVEKSNDLNSQSKLFYKQVRPCIKFSMQTQYRVAYFLCITVFFYLNGFLSSAQAAKMNSCCTIA